MDNIWSVDGVGIYYNHSEAGAIAVCNFKPPMYQPSYKCAKDLPRIPMRAKVVDGISVSDPVNFLGQWHRVGSARRNPLSRFHVRQVAFPRERWVLYKKGNRWLAVNWGWATEYKNMQPHLVSV